MRHINVFRLGTTSPAVMPGLVPGIHVFLAESKTWMAGTIVKPGDMPDRCSETSFTLFRDFQDY
jgi:hypothetical protein